MSGDSVLKELGTFDAQSLSHVETNEKTKLPTKEDIEKEKTEKSLNEEIEKGKKLKHVQALEKCVLPSKEDIEQEKSLSPK